jgi:hypothetical protein
VQGREKKIAATNERLVFIDEEEEEGEGKQKVVGGKEE